MTVHVEEHVSGHEDNSAFRLCDRDRKLAEEVLRETPRRRKQCLRDLRAWVRGQNHLVNCRTDSNFLLRFLRFTKFHMPETQTVIEKYVHMRTQHKAWFHNLDVLDPKMVELFSSGYLFVLPERDRNGRRVVFSRAAAIDVDKFTACDIMRAHIIVYETLLCDEENQVKGLTYVFDERDINWSHIRLWSPSEISKAFHCCERALPLRHQEIHFVHLPWTMTIVFQFAKSLLSQKLRDRFQTHGSFDKLTSGTDFPTHILPEGYGSGTVPAKKMIASWMREMEAKRSQVLALDNMRYGLHTHMNIHHHHHDHQGGEGNAGNGGILDIVGSVRKMENGKES